jgi:hypothetical protein
MNKYVKLIEAVLNKGFDKDQQKTIISFLKKLGFKDISTNPSSINANIVIDGETKNIDIEKGRRLTHSDKRKNNQNNLSFVIMGENEDYPVENRWGVPVDEESIDSQIKEMLIVIKSSLYL